MSLNPETLAGTFLKECQAQLKTPEAAHRSARAKYFQPLSYFAALDTIYSRQRPGSPVSVTPPPTLMKREIAQYRQRLLELEDQVWYFYAWGYFLRSIEKTLLNDRLALVRFLQGLGISEHYSYHLACYRLLCTYHGLMLAPSVETLLKTRSESLIAGVTEALEQAPDKSAVLRSNAAFRRVFSYAKILQPANALRPVAVGPGVAPPPVRANGEAAHSQKRARVQPSESSAFRACATKAAEGAGEAAGAAGATGAASSAVKVVSPSFQFL